MRVRAGDTIYDSEAVPVIIEVTEEEKRILADMPEGTNRLALFASERDKHWVQQAMADFDDG